MKEERKAYVGYEYQDLKIDKSSLHGYMDGYVNFGWEMLEQRGMTGEPNKVLVSMRRDSRIINKIELTRLQSHFEDCMDQIVKLEKSINSAAVIASMTIALIGTAFMAGSVFAVVADQPNYLLMVLLAIPGFAGWIMPIFVHKKVLVKKRHEINPLIESKRVEVDQVCQKAHGLWD